MSPFIIQKVEERIVGNDWIDCLVASDIVLLAFKTCPPSLLEWQATSMHYRF
jgi:hypothetical protein